MSCILDSIDHDIMQGVGFALWTYGTRQDIQLHIIFGAIRELMLLLLTRDECVSKQFSKVKISRWLFISLIYTVSEEGRTSCIGSKESSSICILIFILVLFPVCCKSESLLTSCNTRSHFWFRMFHHSKTTGPRLIKIYGAFGLLSE